MLAARGMTSEEKAMQNAEDERNRLLAKKRQQHVKQCSRALVEAQAEEAATRIALDTAYRRIAEAMGATPVLFGDESKERRDIEDEGATGVFDGLIAFWRLSCSIVQRVQTVTSHTAEYLKL
jgi:hypothetical protein